MGKRPEGRWLLRLVLGIGIAAFLPADSFFSSYPLNTLLGVVVFLAMLFGLVSVIWIIRGSSNEPPSWRYRDR